MDRRGFQSADKLSEDHVLKFLFGPTESTVPLYKLNQIAPLFTIDFSGLIMVREECLRRFRSRTFSRDTAWSRRPGAGLLTQPGSHQPVGVRGHLQCLPSTSAARDPSPALTPTPGHRPYDPLLLGFLLWDQLLFLLLFLSLCRNLPHHCHSRP